MSKIDVTCEHLESLSQVAIRNGTTRAFIDVALQWAQAANTEIDRLQQENGRLRAAAQQLVDYRQRVGALCFQLEKADEYIRELALALDPEAPNA